MTGLQTESMLSHDTLPKLHLSKCRGGRLAVHCAALRELVMKVGVIQTMQRVHMMQPLEGCKEAVQTASWNRMDICV